MANDLSKSIEELEDSYWQDCGLDTYVVRTGQAARKKPLSQLTNEEVRLLIGQRIGLKYVIPLAVSIVSAEPFIEVTFYEGDLLGELLQLSEADWKDDPEELESFMAVVRENISAIRTREYVKDRFIGSFPELELNKKQSR